MLVSVSFLINELEPLLIFFEFWVQLDEMLTLASWGRGLLIVNKPESMNQVSDNWAVYHRNKRIFCRYLYGMSRVMFVLIWTNSRGFI